MERPTKQITLPDSGALVTLYESLTYGDYRKIQRALTDSVKISYNEGEKPRVDEIPASIMMDQSEMTVKFLVKEVTLDKVIVNDLDKFIYDLSINDGDLLYKTVEELTGGSVLSKEDKKK